MVEGKLIQSQVNKFRKDKFLLVLTVPNILKSLNENQIRDNKLLNLNSLQFSVYQLTIPKVSIPAHPVHFGQQNHNISSYNREAYAPLTINFEVDNEFNNYWILWKWAQLLNDPKDATYAGTGIFPNSAPEQQPPIVTDYATQLVAYSLDEYNNRKVKFSFSSFISFSIYYTVIPNHFNSKVKNKKKAR